VDPQLTDSISDRSDIAGVSCRKTLDADENFSPGPIVAQRPEPLGEFVSLPN